MARRLENTVANAVREAVGELAINMGLKLGVVIMLPDGPIGDAVEPPIRESVERAGLKTQYVADPAPMLLVTEPEQNIDAPE